MPSKYAKLSNLGPFKTHKDYHFAQKKEEKKEEHSMDEQYKS